MSTDPAGHPTEQQAGPESAPGNPSEEELRAAYEAELSRITSADMMLQAAVSLLNIGARRLGLMAEPPGGGPEGTGGDADAPRDPSLAQRDLDQVRDAVDGVKAVLEVEPLSRQPAVGSGQILDLRAQRREIALAGGHRFALRHQLGAQPVDRPGQGRRVQPRRGELATGRADGDGVRQRGRLRRGFADRGQATPAGVRQGAPRGGGE